MTADPKDSGKATLDADSGARGSERPALARVIVAKGRGRPQSLALHPGDEVHIGRSDDCGLMLISDVVSRRHATIFWRDGAWLVGDAGSKNGTTVNQIEVAPDSPVELRDLDRIRICEHHLLYLAGDVGSRRLRTIAIDRDQVSAEAEEALRKFMPELGDR